jgi:hypothetical protein
MLSPLLVLFGCLVPVVVGRMTAGKRPLDVFLVGYPLRMLTSLVYVPVLIIAYRAYRQETDEGFSYFYWSLIGATALHQVSVPAFATRVSYMRALVLDIDCPPTDRYLQTSSTYR